MQVINAFWEKRNLGIDCIEIKLTSSDTIEILEDVLKGNSENQYLVVKVPVGNFSINQYLNSNGFIFIEEIFELKLSIKNAFLSVTESRINESISYRLTDRIGLINLENEIRKGIFNTDRVYIDPFLGVEKSANRYINWINDEASRGASIYEIIYKDNSIGFFTLKEVSPNVYYPFLAGLYTDYKNSGLGLTILSKPIEEVKNRGGNTLITYVSSNNPNVLRLHIHQGFQLYNSHYVFIKHN